MLECFHNYRPEKFSDWIKLWPTQFTLNVLNIKLTKKLEDCFVAHHISKSRKVPTTVANRQSGVPAMKRQVPNIRAGPSPATKPVEIPRKNLELEIDTTSFAEPDQSPRRKNGPAIGDDFKTIYTEINKQITELS